MADEVLTVQITVNGGDKAAQTVNGVSKSTTGLSSALTMLIPGANITTGALENMGGMMTKLAPTIGVSTEAAAGMSSSLIAMAGPIAAVVAAVGIATLAFTGMGKAISFSMAQAEEAQKAEVQLEAVIKSTGGVAGVTSEQIRAMASEMSQLTGVSDDLIISSSNILLTFTQIGKDVFPQVQETALDLSQAFGMDLQSASVMLGKALQDPATGMTALTRVGVTFSEEMKAAAQNMVEHGQIARAQGMILEEVARQVGGSAEAMGATVFGEKNKISNLLKEMGEDFGKAFQPLQGELLVVVRQFLTEVTRTMQPAMALLRNELRGFQNVLRQPEMQTAIRDLIKSMAELFGEGAVIGVKAMSEGVKAFLSGWRAHGPETVRFIKSIVGDLVILAQTINRVMDMMGRLGSAMAGGPGARQARLPGYASGVTNAPGGWAMVGESGPELMQVPRGANIYPSGSAPTAAMGGMKIYGPISITAPSDGSLSALMHNLEAAATATA